MVRKADRQSPKPPHVDPAANQDLLNHLNEIIEGHRSALQRFSIRKHCPHIIGEALDYWNCYPHLFAQIYFYKIGNRPLRTDEQSRAHFFLDDAHEEAVCFLMRLAIKYKLDAGKLYTAGKRCREIFDDLDRAFKMTMIENWPECLGPSWKHLPDATTRCEIEAGQEVYEVLKAATESDNEYNENMGSSGASRGENGKNETMQVASNPKNDVRLPENEEVKRLIFQIQNEPAQGRRKAEIAREITGETCGSAPRAETLLRQARRYLAAAKS